MAKSGTAGGSDLFPGVPCGQFTARNAKGIMTWRR